MKEIAIGMFENPCTGCAMCGTSCGVKALYLDLKGTSTFTGVVATPQGFKKLHADSMDLDAEGHNMSIEEFNLDMSLYDGASTYVPEPPDGIYASVQEAEPYIQETFEGFLKRGKEGGYNCQATPSEVRRGDTVYLWLLGEMECCEDKRCKSRLTLATVLAVHSEQKGIVVDQRDVCCPFRISLKHVFGSLPQKHW